MKFSINELNQCEQEIEIELTYEEIKDELDAEVKKQAKNVQLPGFRKGKVPPAILKSRFGDALEYEASEKIATQQFWKIAKENNLKPVGTPSLTDIQFNPGSNLNFKVKYEIIPLLNPENYTGLEIRIPDYKVTDHEVDHEIEHILRANSTTENVEIVGEDEFYILTVEMQRVDENGSPYQESKPETMEIDLSNHNVNADIRKNAKGKKVGETFSFSFIDDRAVSASEHSEAKSSERYHYSVLVKEIKKIILPELTEELIKKVTKNKVSSSDQLREEIRQDIINYYNQQSEDLLKRKLMSSIISSNEFTPPSSLVQNVLEELVKQEEENAKRMGVKKIDKNKLKERVLPSAQFEVKWYLLKNEILKKEGITISESELSDLASKDAEKTGIAFDKLINYYKSSGITEKLLDKKLYEFLKEKNNIIKVSPESLQNQ